MGTGAHLAFLFSLSELCFTEEHVRIYESFITRFVRQHLSVAKKTNPFKVCRLKGMSPYSLVSDLRVCCLPKAMNPGLASAEIRLGFPADAEEAGARDILPNASSLSRAVYHRSAES